LHLELWQVEALTAAMMLPLCERLMRLGVEPPKHAILATVLPESSQLAEIVTDERAFVAVTFKSSTKLILRGSALHECTQDIKAIVPAAPAAAFALFAGGWQRRSGGRLGMIFRTSFLAWDIRGLAVTAPGSAVDVLLSRATKVGPLGVRQKRAAMLRRIRNDMRHHEVAKSAVVGEITDPATLRVPLAGWIQRPGAAVRSWFDTGASFNPWLFLRLLDELLGVEQPLGFRSCPSVTGGDAGLLAMDDPQSLDRLRPGVRPVVLPVENAETIRDVETAKDVDTVSRHVDQLPESERQAVDYWLDAEREGVDFRAYCEARGRRYHTVRQALRRARRRLHEKIVDD
jgi:hypothetical protein